MRICTQWFVALFSAHLTPSVSLLEFACVHNVPMMEKRCVAQMERPTTTYVSFSGSHAKATLLWRWPEKVHVMVGFRYCISSVCFVVPFGERGAKKETRNAIMTKSRNKRRLPFTRKTRKFWLENEMVQTTQWPCGDWFTSYLYLTEYAGKPCPPYANCVHSGNGKTEQMNLLVLSGQENLSAPLMSFFLTTKKVLTD